MRDLFKPWFLRFIFKASPKLKTHRFTEYLFIFARMSHFFDILIKKLGYFTLVVCFLWHIITTQRSKLIKIIPTFQTFFLIRSLWSLPYISFNFLAITFSFSLEILHLIYVVFIYWALYAIKSYSYSNALTHLSSLCQFCLFVLVQR